MQSMALEVDREAFEKLQFMSVQKAINQQEIPAKEKHIRTAILGTYQEKDAVIFWHVARRLQLSTHAITCWKFCHVLHKLLRDGHEKTLDRSIQYKQQIKDLANIWIHATQTYGAIISKYCKYLVHRMEFVHKYREFPGNLSITDEAFEGIGNSDVNSYFELCVHIMDCLEYLMDLQEGIFKTLDFSKAVSMTGPGQCRLAPCIPVMLDSSQFYDYSLKLLFKLHGCLPPDTLTGHRDRFSLLFDKLKRFFYQCSNMQYFKRLVQIPLLPDEPPNFLITFEEHHQLAPALIIQSDGPQAIEREPSPEPLVDPLPQAIDGKFDTVFGSSDSMGDFSFSHQPDPRDELIRSLKAEIHKLKQHIEKLTQDHVSEIQQLLDRITELEREQAVWKSGYNTNKIEIQNLKKELVMAHDQVDQGSKNLVTLSEVERKAAANEELYKKMKDKYMSLVKDHADLMRKSADFQKHTETMQLHANEHENARLQLLDENEKLRKSLVTKDKDLGLAIKSKQDDSYRMFLSGIEATELMIKEAMRDMNEPLNAQSTCSAASLMKTIEATMVYLDDLHRGARHFVQSNDHKLVMQSLAAFGHSIAQTLLNGMNTCHLVSEEAGKELSFTCCACGEESLRYLAALKSISDDTECEFSPEYVRHILEKLLVTASDLLPKMTDIGKEYLQDVVEQEMSTTSHAIESAAMRIEEMLSQARERDTGMNLEVNERILDSCTELMQAIKVLIISSKDLQREIVDEGRGASSVKEFYMKNSRWTEGLISAAKAVGFGATLLTDAADQAVVGQGKFEEIIVCSHEIAASTAQLVAASRVKANKMSEKLPKVQAASKDVNAAAGQVVASANTARKQIEEGDEDITKDLSKVTLTQIKRKEMDSQVRVLELEQCLQQERVKLGKLRKQHYLLAGIEREEEFSDKDYPINNTANNNNENIGERVTVDPPPRSSKVKPPLPIKPSWT